MSDDELKLTRRLFLQQSAVATTMTAGLYSIAMKTDALAQAPGPFFAADGPDKTLAIPVKKFWFTQPTILFSYGAAPRDMTEAIEWIASGKVHVSDLITHRFPIEQTAQAFDLAANPHDNSLKVIIQPT